MEKPQKSVIITGMICITALEALALFLKIDGYVFATVLAILAGLSGLVLPQLKLRK